MVDWKQVVITCVFIVCVTIAFGIVVTGFYGCVQQQREYQLKYLEQRK